jgi:hypothetical protein
MTPRIISLSGVVYAMFGVAYGGRVSGENDNATYLALALFVVAHVGSLYIVVKAGAITDSFTRHIVALTYWASWLVFVGAGVFTYLANE